MMSPAVSQFIGIASLALERPRDASGFHGDGLCQILAAMQAGAGVR
jgi:hypothetical protein